jgi:SRSO17 transposase
MTDKDITELGPVFAGYLRRYRNCFLQGRTAAHFDNYCRGLLSDLPRKSVEPIALSSGTAVRTLQEFMTFSEWEQDLARTKLQTGIAEVLDGLPPDPLGNVGVIDETSSLKKGDKTPGVQRQYLGCVGKLDNGIVTVHVGVARGTFQALLDADLYLPEEWDADRDRCGEAGIPDSVRYRPKWQIAYDQLVRLDAHGVKFDWLVFDEGYGSKVPFLRVLETVGQRFVGEVPVNFWVRPRGRGKGRRADAVLRHADAKRGRVFTLSHRTIADSVWRATSVPVEVKGCAWVLVAALNESTGELKYFVTNATEEPLSQILAAAFRRATIEHNFRVAKTEIGLMHYEGRKWLGLMRHLILALVVMGFVSIHTDRLRGEKSAGDDGASVPCFEHPLCPVISSPTEARRVCSGRTCDPLPPAPEQSCCRLTQKEALDKPDPEVAL